MSVVRRVAFVAIFISVAWTTAPRLLEGVRRAFDFRDLHPHERRRLTLGLLYDSVLKIDAAVRPRDLPLAIIAAGGPDTDAALFMAYYFFPRQTRLYGNLEAYRMDPQRPSRIVHIDQREGFVASLLTYQQVRAKVIGTNHIVYAPSPAPDLVTSFVVPLVSSGDGPPPDMYTTEAVMENPGPNPARVTVRIFPSGKSAVIKFKPGERRTATDFVEQVFHTMEVGWLEVRSDQPVQTRFWLVNRGIRDADVLRHAEFFREATLTVPAKGRLWVLNPHDRELPVKLNEGDHRLPPRSLIPLEWVGAARLKADDDWYGFVSWRDAEGNTRMEWPEAGR